MVSTAYKQNLLCCVLGISVALVVTFTVGFTSAIASPDGLFDWFKARASLDAGLFLWELTVVFGLGAGLPVFLALLTAFRFSVRPTVRSALFFLGGFLLVGYVLVPLVYGAPLSLALSRPWWAYALELSLIVATLSALLVARRLWPDNSFKPNPLRGSAVPGVSPHIKLHDD